VRAASRSAIVTSLIAAASGGLLAIAAPASAASLSAPSVVTSATKVTIVAHTDAVQAAQLVFNGKVVRSAGPLQLGSTLSYTFATAPLRNGSYPVALRQQLAVAPWYTAASARIRLRIPPAAPTSVGAHLLSGRTVRVTWARGTEPDLSGYAVRNTSVAEVTWLGVRSACGTATCAAMVSLPAMAGPTVGFAVVAYRSDGAGGTLASAVSPIVRVSIPGAAGAAGGRLPGIAAGGSAAGAGGFDAVGGYGRRDLPTQAFSGGSPLVQPTVGPHASPLTVPHGRTVGAPAVGPSLAAGAGYVVAAGVLIALLALAHIAVWRWRRRLPAPAAGPALSSSALSSSSAAESAPPVGRPWSSGFSH